MKNVYEKICAYDQGLLPAMLEFKYKRMRIDYYRFFRGSCHLYYENLLKNKKELPLSPVTWICGDLHMENFGSFKGDNRLVYFDLNDFDESILAPVSCELIHFLSSIFIAFETLQLEDKKANNMAAHFLKKYSETLASGKSSYIDPQSAQGIVRKFLSTVSKRPLEELLKKRTIEKNDQLTLHVNNKKYLAIDKELRNELILHLTDWIVNQSGSPYNFEVSDVVFRKAGLGSLGLKRYMILLKSTNVKEEYLLLDMKQARPSALVPYISIKQPGFNTEAERIISIQQRMQNVTAALLSTTVFKDDSYVIHELHPTRDSLNFDLIKHDYRNIYQAINDMAVLTASSHLRSSGREGSAIADELIAFGKNTEWHTGMTDEAVLQCDEVKKNYEAFVKESTA